MVVKGLAPSIRSRCVSVALDRMRSRSFWLHVAHFMHYRCIKCERPLMGDCLTTPGQCIVMQ